MKMNARRRAIKFHAKKEGGIPHILDVEFLLVHLGAKEERVLSHDDQIVNVGEDPQRRGLRAPEHAWIRDGNGETNGFEERTQSSIPGERGLLEAIDGLLELQNNVLPRAVARRRKHKDFLLQITS
jgi:hypothetical protein